MKYIMQIVIALIVVGILYYIFMYRWGPMNTENVVIGGKNYNVHNAHADKEAAARMLAEIMKRNRKLIEHLREKFVTSAETYSAPNEDNQNIQNYTDFEHSETIAEIQQLVTRYDEDSIYEISPLNKMGYTSYTENKGDRIVYCLRSKRRVEGGADPYPIHDINTLMFVNLHELTHIMTKKYGHHSEFWENFKFILQEAVEIGIYDPVDYSKYPIDYCGLNVYYNPLYDGSRKSSFLHH